MHWHPFRVLCTEAIAAHERAGVLQALRSTGHEVIEITLEQMLRFAATCGACATNVVNCVWPCAKCVRCIYGAQRQRLQALAGR